MYRVLGIPLISKVELFESIFWLLELARSFEKVFSPFSFATFSSSS